MGAHVSAAPNEQLHRYTPLETRGNVSAFGSFGYELDLNKLTQQERAIVKEQITFIKKYRKIIHNGIFYRLMSPFDGNYCAWMVVSEDKRTVLVGQYKVLNEVNAPFRRLQLIGLDPSTEYVDIADGKGYYGDELMHIGLVTSDASCGQVLDGRKPSCDFDSKIYIFEAK